MMRTQASQNDRSDASHEIASDMELIFETAADFVERMGQDALAYLDTQADIAAGFGDLVSEEAYRDIAKAAAKLLH